MGGRKASNGYGNSRLFIIFIKPHIFEATSGAIKGGRMVGAKMEVRMGGRIFAYMVGRWGGASDTCEPICSEKNGIFEFRNLIEI